SANHSSPCGLTGLAHQARELFAYRCYLGRERRGGGLEQVHVTSVVLGGLCPIAARLVQIAQRRQGLRVPGYLVVVATVERRCRERALEQDDRRIRLPAPRQDHRRLGEPAVVEVHRRAGGCVVPGEESRHGGVPSSLGHGDRTNGIRGIGTEPHVCGTRASTPLVEQLACLTQ